MDLNAEWETERVVICDKTYAYFDAIGMKEALKTPEGILLLYDFWKQSDIWLSRRNWYNDSDDYLFKGYGEMAKEPSPNVYLRVFSDSAILSMDKEYPLKTFYKIVNHYMEHLKTAAKLPSYCIINSDKEVKPPTDSATGGLPIDDKHIPYFIKIAGIGPAWGNIFLALPKLEKQNAKVWHDKYKMYCIGENNIVPPYRNKGGIPIKGINEKGQKVTVYLHALE